MDELTKATFIVMSILLLITMLYENLKNNVERSHIILVVLAGVVILLTSFTNIN